MIHTQALDYQVDDQVFEAFVAYEDGSGVSKKPAVLIAHAWAGRDEFVCEKAKQIARLGYVGIALDVYGKGVLGGSLEINAKLMNPLMADRLKLQKRLLAGLAASKALAFVDKNKMAAIGYCFGGLCALDLARAGADLCGVVSVHGLLSADKRVPSQKILAKVLALHGYDDPMVPPDMILDFAKEMTSGKVDWQFHIFGNTMHAFTNPAANDLKLALLYHASADKRSSVYMQSFFEEIFA